MDLSLAQSLRRQNQDEVIHVKHYILRLKLDKTKKPSKISSFLTKAQEI